MPQRTDSESGLFPPYYGDAVGQTQLVDVDRGILQFWVCMPGKVPTTRRFGAALPFGGLGYLVKAADQCIQTLEVA